MKSIDPFAIFHELQSVGSPAPLRLIAERFASAGDNLDDVVIAVEKTLDEYARTCSRTREDPIATLRPIDDMIDSPCLADLPSQIDDLQRQATLQVRAWLTYYIRMMNWSKFESLCREVFNAMRLTDVALTNKGPDGGIDFTGTYFNPVYKEMAYPIIGQAKHWNPDSPVRVVTVRELAARLAAHKSSAVQGFLLCTSYFTPDAETEAAESPRKIHLWGMKEITDQIVSLRVGLVPSDSSIEMIDAPHWDRFLE